MNTKINTIRTVLFCLSITLGSCNNSVKKKQANKNPTNEIEKKVINPQLGQYKYTVAGTDEFGNNVHGKINVEGIIGVGALIRTDTKEIEIVVERLNKHKLVGTDLEGNKYHLTIQ